MKKGEIESLEIWGLVGMKKLIIVRVKIEWDGIKRGFKV